MPRITHLLPLLALISACSGPAHRTITAHIEGAGGRTLYFDRFQNNRPTHQDSVVLDAEGKGALKVPTLPLDFYGLTLGDNDMLVLVLDSTEGVDVQAKAGSLRTPTSVKGSTHSEALHRFFTEAQGYNTEKETLIAQLTSNPGDSAAMARINALNTDFYEACKRFAKENSSSPVALAAMNYVNPETDLELHKEVREALRRTIPRSEYFAGFRDRVDRAEKQLAAMKAQEAQAAQLDNLLPVGGPAPDFSQATPEGGTLALSDLRGQVVLIDFWASWCKPCRMENPHVKKVYEKYHRKGFEILGVSLDREKGAWTNAIAQDGLPWKHVSDLGFWNNAAAQQYGVNSIPYTVLVDKQGNVLAKNLRGGALEQKLAEVFK